MSAAPLLAVSELEVRYGVITAVRGVDLEVHNGEVVAIVGPNGAGKTSLLSAIAGVARTTKGTMTFEGRQLNGVVPEDIVRRGVALVPEGRHIFASLSVLENLMLGATVRPSTSAVQADVDHTFQTFPILGERRRQPAGQLSGGEQQQLAIARALMSRPRLLLLDEPSLGLAPAMVDHVYELLATIKDQGVSILLVEQNASRAFAIANRAAIMSGGRFALTGSPEVLAADERFDAAYFGTRMSGQVVGP
jgi:branched-chain amino acid transport system ATP-binding protein